MTTEKLCSVVKPLVKAFIEKMTVDQWRSLVSPSPDHASIILLAELILDIIHDVSDFLLNNIRCGRVPNGEDTMNTLHTELLETFSESLGLEDQAEDASVSSLAHGIQKETEGIVTSAITEECTKEYTYIIQPDRLNAIINTTIELFRKFGYKIKAVEQCCKSWFQKKDEDTEPLPASTDMEGEPLDSRDTLCSPQDTSESVQEEIRKNWSDISSTLLDDITVGQFKKLESESSKEIHSVLSEIDAILSKKRKQPFQALRNKLKSFFGMSFLRVWLCRLLANVKKRHPKDTREESLEVVDSIIESLTPEFENMSHREVGNEHVIAIFQQTSRHNVLHLTRGLTDFIYHNVFVGDTSGSKGVSTPRRRYNLYYDIWKQSMICISIMKWFTRAQTKKLCKRLNLHRLEVESSPVVSEPAETDILPTPSTTSTAKHSEEPFTQVTKPGSARRKGASKVQAAGATSKKREGVTEAVETQLKKSYIGCFVDMVVFHVCSEAAVVVEDKHKLSNLIFERICAEVEDETMYITQSTFRNMRGKIHKCLCKRFKPQELLYLMASLDPAVMELIVSLVKDSLMTPPKKTTFLSALAKFLRKVTGK